LESRFDDYNFIGDKSLFANDSERNLLDAQPTDLSITKIWAYLTREWDLEEEERL